MVEILWSLRPLVCRLKLLPFFALIAGADSVVAQSLTVRRNSHLEDDDLMRLRFRIQIFGEIGSFPSPRPVRE